MTDEMLALADDNKRKAGVANVEFLKGQIEQVPHGDQRPRDRRNDRTLIGDQRN